MPMAKVVMPKINAANEATFLILLSSETYCERLILSESFRSRKTSHRATLPTHLIRRMGQRIFDFLLVFLRLRKNGWFVECEHAAIFYNNFSRNHHPSHIRGFERVHQFRIDVVHGRRVWRVGLYDNQVRFLAGLKRANLLFEV